MCTSKLSLTNPRLTLQFTSSFSGLEEDEFLSLQVPDRCSPAPAHCANPRPALPRPHRRTVGSAASRGPILAAAVPAHSPLPPPRPRAEAGALRQMQDYGTYKIVTQEDRRKLFSLLQARARARVQSALRAVAEGGRGAGPGGRAARESGWGPKRLAARRDRGWRSSRARRGG